MPVYRRKYRDKKTGKIRMGSYYFKFEIDGTTYKETVKTARTRRQAEEAERRAREDVHEGVYGVSAKKRLFSSFVREVYLPWAERHHRDSQHDRLHAALLCKHFEGRLLGQISQLSVEGFKLKRANCETRRGRPRSPYTVNSEMASLSRILALAVEHKLIRENPCAKVRRLHTEERAPRRLSEDEERALLESCSLYPLWLRPMIQLALWTGFRQGELIALSQSAIDFSRNLVFVVNPKWRRDKRKTEGVPMGGQARELLAQLCSQRQGDLLFTDDEGRMLKRHRVDYFFRKACASAGVTGLRFHDLRHEYGSRLGDSDVNLKKISRLMGHSKTRQTERYVHPTDDGLLIATEHAATQRRTTIVPHKLRQVG